VDFGFYWYRLNVENLGFELNEFRGRITHVNYVEIMNLVICCINDEISVYLIQNN